MLLQSIENLWNLAETKKESRYSVSTKTWNLSIGTVWQQSQQRNRVNLIMKQIVMRSKLFLASKFATSPVWGLKCFKSKSTLQMARSTIWNGCERVQETKYMYCCFRVKMRVVPSRPIRSNSSAIEPNRTPIVRLPNSIEHNRTHNKILPIEHNRTFDYRTIGNRTQSNVRLPNDWYNRTFD